MEYTHKNTEDVPIILFCSALKQDKIVLKSHTINHPVYIAIFIDMSVSLISD